MISGALPIPVVNDLSSFVVASLSGPTGGLGEELELVALQSCLFPSPLKHDYENGSFVLFQPAFVSEKFLKTHQNTEDFFSILFFNWQLNPYKQVAQGSLLGETKADFDALAWLPKTEARQN